MKQFGALQGSRNVIPFHFEVGHSFSVKQHGSDFREVRQSQNQGHSPLGTALASHLESAATRFELPESQHILRMVAPLRKLSK